jgi:hypothetical protein
MRKAIRRTNATDTDPRDLPPPIHSLDAAAISRRAYECSKCVEIYDNEARIVRVVA